jgi:hypothetical protein
MASFRRLATLGLSDVSAPLRSSTRPLTRRGTSFGLRPVSVDLGTDGDLLPGLALGQGRGFSGRWSSPVGRSSPNAQSARLDRREANPRLGVATTGGGLRTCQGMS